MTAADEKIYRRDASCILYNKAKSNIPVTSRSLLAAKRRHFWWRIYHDVSAHFNETQSGLAYRRVYRFRHTAPTLSQ